ncbi:3-hydroxyacyl-CoA dehydrogenase [Desulfitobacterium dichloroeliminans LMG P-21439]|uniref:3-hydroxyacyl-CoA dehydrogenase n=1 Tax=Desulfitobacterium dichloroeliminans (strain LMG P-21439 / DCA1) TaxID=871963 RepID=L0F5I0_DESDL|nr:3-hydroxyacyl-CoA dehydrogenase family protein [Desulfitobacterium dichloroeliminans]AGA68203.1 3-hydroxyacyl-CoA dehydrogenase [Desulfitobacterium dichloroeliminans LMG P-21439]
MNIVVIGSGVMGPGIAQVFLMGGHHVIMSDIKVEALAEGTKEIRNSLTLMASKGITNQDVTTLMSNFQTMTSLEEAVKDADLVIEAIPEVINIKQKVYEDLDQFCPKDTVIVSNTSALPLPEIFPHFRPGSFFVAHFMNPPQIIPLVEIVKNDKTNPEKVAWLREVLEKCGKKPIVINQFIKGFLINRMQTAMAREALYLYEKGVVSLEDLDVANTACIGFKSAWQGTFETMDYIGLDTCAFAYNIIFPDLCNDTTVPATVTQKVKEGKLGLKSGEGFFTYPEDSNEVSMQRQAGLLEQLKLFNDYIKE